MEVQICTWLMVLTDECPTFAHLGIIMGQSHVHIHLIFVSFMLPGGLIKDQETCVEVGHRGPDPASALGEY